MEDEISTGKTGKIPLRYKTLMVAVAITTLLVVWMVPDNEQQTAQPQPLPELPTTQKVKPDLSQPAEGDAAVIREGDRARDFIASLSSGHTTPDPDTVFVEAKRLQDEGYAVDAYLLYRFAARQGNGQAALVLGTQADPAFQAADVPDSLKDQPEQAYRWYSIAVAAGNDEAATRLQALHKRLEQAASTGDERAQRLLLLWQ
jgi:hypothetical protein